VDKETTIRLLKDQTCFYCKFTAFEELLSDRTSYQIICQWTNSKLPETKYCEKFKKFTNNGLWRTIINGS
jgi:hypothetical protein